MLNRPKVLFVILTWNSESYIEACIDSVLRCEGLDVRVVVVDNGSHDSTVDLLNKKSKAFGNLECVPLETNLGTTVSRNIALRMVPNDVDYICILDSDTVVNTEAMHKMIEVLRHDEKIGLVGPVMYGLDGSKQLSGRNLPTFEGKLYKAIPMRRFQEKGTSLELPKSDTVNGLKAVPYLLSACWIMRRSLIDEVGLLDERIFYSPEDVDYCVRVWKSGRKVVLCEDAEIIHAYQRISKKKLISKMNFEHVKGLAYYFKKHRYLFDASKIVDLS